MNWIKTSEQTPSAKNDEYQTKCLVVFNGMVRILTYNHHYELWDDEDGDDFICERFDVEYWMPLPESPNLL